MTIKYIPEILGIIITEPYKQKSFDIREADLSCSCGEINGTFSVMEAHIIAVQHEQKEPSHEIILKEICCGGMSF